MILKNISHNTSPLLIVIYKSLVPFVKCKNNNCNIAMKITAIKANYIL